MAIKLQLAQCNFCNGYYSSTVLNPKDINNPEIIDYYFYYGEPLFTLDKKTFERSVNHKHTTIHIVDFEEHTKKDHKHCFCTNEKLTKKDNLYHLIPSSNNFDNTLDEYADHDIYFYDLYITYNNFHQDTTARQAI